MKKPILVIGLMLVIVSLLSGCIEDTNAMMTRQEYEDMGYQTTTAYLTMSSDSRLFDFSSDVLDNGSVYNTTSKTIHLNIKNNNDVHVKDLSFRLSVFPDELLLRTVDLMVLYPKTTVGNFLVHYGSKGSAFGFLEIKPNNVLEVDLVLTFRNSPVYTFQNNVTYNVVVDIVQEYLSGVSTTRGETFSTYTTKFQCNVRT